MRNFTAILFAAAALASPVRAESVWDRGAPLLAKPVEATVYRSPSCGCCGLWLEHMKKQGFIVKDIKTEQMAQVKQQYGVPENLRSCHTAVIEGHVVEGHVPAADVRDLLAQRPKAAGLAVPGMVSGSPGMEMGGKQDPFSVVEFDRNGARGVFRDHSDYRPVTP